MELRLSPARLLEDMAIEFDGDSRAIDLELAEQAEHSQAFGSHSRFAVNDNLEWHALLTP
jgi:hypothetical protein